jgi:hypothetical protein
MAVDSVEYMQEHLNNNEAITEKGKAEKMSERRSGNRKVSDRRVTKQCVITSFG